MGEKLNLRNIIKVMMRDECNWQIIHKVIMEVMNVKRMDERVRMATQ